MPASGSPSAFASIPHIRRRAVPEFPNPPAAPADYQSFDTLPGVQAPILSVTVPDRDPAAGDILTTNGPGPGQYGPLIYTPQGRLVWFDQLSGGEAAENLSVQSYEGRRDLTLWQGKVLSLGFGQGEDIVMDSRYQTVARIAGGNGLQADLHDFQIVPHDIAYITAYNPIRCDLTPVEGAPDGAIVDTAIQEIDMKTGLVRWEWHSLDHIGAAESEVEAPTDATPWDYFHLNSIDPEPDGNLLISARSTWAGYQLEGGTGKVLWRLGGNKSSFKMGPGTKMAWQHDGRILAERRSHLLRRRLEPADPPPVARACGSRSTSRPSEARLAPPTRTPTRRCSPPARATCRRCADGNTLVGYGGVPAISEYRPGRLAAVRRPSAVRHVLLPGLPLPLERPPAEPAGGARQPEQHGRRDDRARELERRDRRGLLARARGRAAPDR